MIRLERSKVPSLLALKLINFKASTTLDVAVSLNEERNRWVKPLDEHTHTHVKGN